MTRAFYPAAMTLLLIGSAHGAPLSSDTASRTANGATFMAPAGWVLEALPDRIRLSPPEPDTHLAILTLPDANDAKHAIAKAWEIWRPGFATPVQLATPRPPRDGWEQKWDFGYLTPPNARTTIEALAQRSAGHWTILLIDGTEATTEKRSGAIRLIEQSLRAPGYHRETFAGRTPHRLDGPRIALLKDFVQDSMRQLGIPGAGLALFDQERIVYEGGLGIRTLGDPAPVDAHTLFMVASNTKGMTTLLLSELVDQKKLRWDEKVTEVYPTFRLGKAETTSKVLIKHLVCACTGLPRQDMEWLLNTSSSTPAASTFAMLATMQPTSRFGETFQYSNLMASAAGYVAASVVYPGAELGSAYDRAMQAMVFDPLGMHDTTFDFKRALAADHASPHGDTIDGVPALARMDTNEAIVSARPAGGAWSSAHDMIRYVRNELDQGMLPDGKRLVSAQSLLARRAPGVGMGEDKTYGMGLMNDTSMGVPVVHHGGSLSGYKSDIIALPGAGIGAVILTNSDTGQYLLRPFMRRLMEILYDGKPEAAGDIAAAAARMKAKIAEQRARLTIPADPALAAKLAAGYTNAALGHIDVKHATAGVTFDFGAWHSAVASRKNTDGTISFITTDPSEDGVEFVVTTKDDKPALILRDGQHDYTYTAKS